eukprot:767271-Hanusia_phi.AAC.2
MLISDIIPLINNCHYLIVRLDHSEDGQIDEGVKEILCSVFDLCCHIVQLETLSVPIYTIIHKVSSRLTMPADSNCEDVVRNMFLTQSHDMSLRENDGRIIGVVKFQAIVQAVTERKEFAQKDQIFRFSNFYKMDEDEDEDILDPNDKETEAVLMENSATTLQSTLKKAAFEWLNSLFTEILILSLLLLDGVVNVASLFIDSSSSSSCSYLISPKTAVTCVAMFVFMYETIIRLMVYNRSLIAFPIETLDVSVVLVSCLLLAISIFVQSIHSTIHILIIVARIVRGLKLLKLTKQMRLLVSRHKSRYREDGFDLDLTYITPNCIAMSLPASGAEAQYRNPIMEVQRFFETKHFNRYLIFNLCAERSYDKSLFKGQVVRIKVQDHNPPQLDQLLEFLDRVTKWLILDQENVIAIHCKGGKGRTGTFICAWLLYSSIVKTGVKVPSRFCEEVIESSTAEEAMQWFSSHRTGLGRRSNQGVTAASQQRYVGYIERIIRDGGHATRSLVLKKVIMHTCPKMDVDGGCDPWFQIEKDGQIIYDSSVVNNGKVINMSKRQEMMQFANIDVTLYGDVCIRFFDRDYVPPQVRCEISGGYCTTRGAGGSGRGGRNRSAKDTRGLQEESGCMYFSVKT